MLFIQDSKPWKYCKNSIGLACITCLPLDWGRQVGVPDWHFHQDTCRGGELIFRKEIQMLNQKSESGSWMAQQTETGKWQVRYPSWLVSCHFIRRVTRLLNTFEGLLELKYNTLVSLILLVVFTFLKISTVGRPCRYKACDCVGPLCSQALRWYNSGWSVCIYPGAWKEAEVLWCQEVTSGRS